MEKLYLILEVVGYIYYMMISEIDVMLLNGTLKIVCPVCYGFLRMPLPGAKTLQKLQGVHNFALGFLGNVSVA